jgi:proteasome lid subunit RPN8/RPN11
VTNRYTLRLTAAIYEEIVKHAIAELPNECCGILAGNIAGDSATAVRRFSLVNAAVNPRVEYLSESRSILAAHKAIREQKLVEVAVYHSHPTSDPIPSRKDRENNPYDDFVMHLILSLKDGQPRLSGWWIRQDEFSEGRWEIVESEDDNGADSTDVG